MVAAMASLLVPAAEAGARPPKTQPDWIENAVIYEANLRQGTSERNLKGLVLSDPIML